MRRLALATALALLAAALVSCANTPTAPKAMVHLTGTVTDRNGAPIQAVYLDFSERGPYPQPEPLYYPLPPEAIFVHAVTDLNGHYAADVPEGRYWLWIIAPNSTAYAPIMVDKEVRVGDTGFDYQFRSIRLALRPTLSGGQSIDNVDAVAWLSGQYGVRSWARRAGDELEMFVPAGTYHVSAGARGNAFSYPGFYFDVPVTADTTIDLAFTGNPITVHLTGPGGSPLQGYVDAYMPGSDTYAATDANGTAVLYLPNGGYTIDVEAADRTIQGREYPYVSVTGSASLDFDLDGTHWSGTLRRSSDGAPLANAYISVRPIGGGIYQSAYCNTDANGAFHFVVKPNWGHTILIQGGDWGRFDNVVAGADSTFDLVIPDPPPGPVTTRRAIPSLSALLQSRLSPDATGRLR